MSVGVLKCSRILQIVRLRRMLRRWRHKAASAERRIGDEDVPSDVPAGHVAVSVGSAARRYIIRATHLNHPAFKRLLVRAEEEYGFCNREGPLAIPYCDELLFEDLLRFLANSDSDSTRPCVFTHEFGK